MKHNQKPLSETHPTLWRELERLMGKSIIDLRDTSFIQSTTIDLAEHQQVKIDLQAFQQVSSEYDKEFERLKKEIHDFHMEKNAIAMRVYLDAKAEGIAEGEQSALRRVKSVLLERLSLWRPNGATENRSACIERSAEIRAIAADLDLDREEET